MEFRRPVRTVQVRCIACLFKGTLIYPSLNATYMICWACYLRDCYRRGSRQPDRFAPGTEIAE